MTREYDSGYERNKTTTEIGYGPADSVSQVKGVFCDECGLESAHERIWDDADVDAAHLRDLLKNLHATLTAKGFDADARQLARRADELYHQLPPAGVPGRGIGPHREGAPTTINEVLAGAVEAALPNDKAARQEVPA